MITLYNGSKPQRLKVPLVHESDLGLGLVDGPDVELLVLLDALVDLVGLEALAHAPLLDLAHLKCKKLGERILWFCGGS